MESAQDWHAARALLEWHVELGAVDAIGDAPIDRYGLEPSQPKPSQQKSKPVVSTPQTQTAPPPATPTIDYVALAKQTAAAAGDLDALKAAISTFDGCELKHGARNTVFATGNPAARVMIIGEVPDRDEDSSGLPFAGRAGQLLDRMFAAIGMGRDAPLSKDAIYLVNTIPWRPTGGHDPSQNDFKVMTPFLERHVQLVAPEFLVLMGSAPCHAILGKGGIMRRRGIWTEAFGKPALPMAHPTFLLRNPAAKREAWADLLSLQSKLRDTE